MDVRRVRTTVVILGIALIEYMFGFVQLLHCVVYRFFQLYPNGKSLFQVVSDAFRGGYVVNRP